MSRLALLISVTASPMIYYRQQRGTRRVKAVIPWWPGQIDPPVLQQDCRGLARWMPPARLLVEPDILHAPAVGDAVDHDRQPFHMGLPAAGTSIVKDDRASTVLGQLPFDF